MGDLQDNSGAVASADLLIDFRQFARRLEVHHELFQQLWELGEPVFTESVSTAAIVFSNEGVPLRFLFNPKFWAELPDYDRQFVVCHEMLHAVLNHGFRSVSMRVPKWANIAADIAVNHLLTDRFGFVREFLRNSESLCWVDTVFDEAMGPIPAVGLTMEDYYDRIESTFINSGCLLVDEHRFLPARPGSSGTEGSLKFPRAAAELDAQLSRMPSDVLEEINKALGAEAGAQFQRGDQTAGIWCAITPVEPDRQDWESVIRKRLVAGKLNRHESNWIHPDRRFINCEPSFLIPSDQQAERRGISYGRQRCVFFLDASGSTWHLRDRFFALVKSLPEADFDVELCSFDASVYPISPKKLEVMGGGGTRFDILENWLVQPRVDNNHSSNRDNKKLSVQPYPDVVIVLTDGDGTPIHPRHPDRWHWLLTGPNVSCIPTKSAIFHLAKTP